MKVISLGMGQNIFSSNLSLRKRQVEYGKYFNESHLIVFTPNKPEFKTQKLSENITLYPTMSKIRSLYFFDFIKIIRKILKNSDRKDFVLSCQDPFEIGIVGAFIKLIYGLPLHIQIHTDPTHKYFGQSSLLNKIRFFIAKFVIKYSDRVRVVSERVKRSIEPFSKNIDVLPIEVKFKDLKIERLKDWENNKKNINILTICRLEKEKNLEIAIKAFKMVSEKFSNCTFTIVGDGSEREKLKKLCEKLNIENRVIFTGWQNDLEKYYKNTSIYISASLYEGYGIAIVEAASYGLSLVLSETGLTGDVFKNNESAFICDALDEKCFANSILKLCQNEDLMGEMGKKAQKEAEKHLKSNTNYFEKYANSVIKTASNFEKRNLLLRIFHFKKALWHSLIYLRYFICGIIAAAVNIVSLYILTDTAGIWYLYSSVVAFFLSLIISFVLQKFIVFKDKKTDEIHHQFYKFFIVAILGVITNTTIIFICTDIFGIWYILSQIVAGFFVMIQNFILYKFFIFNK